MEKKISIIAAISENRVLGANNKLVWDLPKDWENFHKVTKGKPCMMGRTSYQSEDMISSEKLKIVITRRSLSDLPENVKVAHSIEQAMELLRSYEEYFILGGGKIFEQTLGLSNYMYLTIVHHEFRGDTFFPKINWSEWELVKSKKVEPDDRHAFPFSMNEYQRIVNFL